MVTRNGISRIRLDHRDINKSTTMCDDEHDARAGTVNIAIEIPNPRVVQCRVQLRASV